MQESLLLSNRIQKKKSEFELQKSTYKDEISTASESTHGLQKLSKLVRTLDKRFTKTAKAGMQRTKNDFMNLTLEQKILAGAFNPINMTKKKKEESVLAI